MCMFVPFAKNLQNMSVIKTSISTANSFQLERFLGWHFYIFFSLLQWFFTFLPDFSNPEKIPMIFDIDYFEHVDVLRHFWYSAECTKYCIWAMLSICTAESAKNTFRDNRIRMHNKIYNLIIQNFCISSRFETLKVFSLVKINFSIKLSQVIL